MAHRHPLVRGIPAALAVALLAVALVGAQPAAAGDGRPYLGVQLQALDKNLMESFGIAESQRGVLVSGVDEDSPAAKVGILRGDVITTVGTVRVREPNELQDAIGKLQPDSKATLKLIRKGKPMRVEVTLGEREVIERDDSGPHKMIFRSGTPMMGVEVQQLTPKLGKYFGSEKGLLVVDVHEDSPAAKAGIEEGDVILEVDGKSVTDWQDLHDVLSKHEDGDTVKLTLLRDKARVSKSVEVSMRGQEFDLSALPGMQFWGSDGSQAWARTFRDHMHQLQRTPHDGQGPRVFEFHSDGDSDELRQQLDDLRGQLDDLKDQLEQMRKEKSRG